MAILEGKGAAQALRFAGAKVAFAYYFSPMLDKGQCNVVVDG